MRIDYLTMTRPAPKVMFENVRGYFTEEVLAAESITFLTYRGQPIGYRVTNLMNDVIQYPKTASVNPAWIQKLARDLNALYNTTDFAATEFKPE